MSGQIIAGAGRDLEEASNVLAATNERQDALVAQDAANKLQQARISQEFDPNTGFRNAKEGNAVGQKFIDTYGQQFENTVQTLRDGLQNDNQRRMFDQHAKVQGLQFKGALLSHQAQETDKFNDSTADGSVKLALASMAQRPMDELNFQTSLAQINGTIDATAKRKGFSPEQAAATKAQYLDAAYTTRITSVMDGIPGVVQANPYLAEKMFKQVQDQLGPAAQVHLAAQVQKSVQSVQARDTASSIIFGTPPSKPSDIAPAATGAPLQAVVRDLESSGRDYDTFGNLIQGPVTRTGERAQGSMQVMPATSSNPGFGVTPAKDNSAEELARVGRDYLGAMSARYQDPVLTLAAYNAGPGNVDKWIAKFGDPRSGQISMQDFVNKIPFAETQKYVTDGLHKLNASAGQPDAPIQAPTANQLKTDLYQRVQFARKLAEQQYPGDTAYADAVASRVENYGRTVIANQAAQQESAHDNLITAMMGSSPDGSDKPVTIDQLLANPAAKAAWDQATPSMKQAIQQQFANGGRRNQLTQEGLNTYYELLGKRTNDPESFADQTKTPLSSYFGQLPDHLLLGLMDQQKSINLNDAKEAAKQLNWNQARSSVEDMLKPIGLGQSAKPNSANAKTTEQFYGRLSEELQNYHDQNQRWPQTTDIRKMAATLLTQGKQSGGVLWDSNKRLFEMEDLSKFYVPLPSGDQKTQLASSYQKVMGHAPTDAELQQWYTRYKMQGGK